MSKLLKFYGYSDDTFGEYNITHDDYDNCASGEPIEWLVDAGAEGRLVVFGQYCPGHCHGWMIGVSPYDPNCNDDPIPAWRMWFEPCKKAPYTAILSVEAPDSATIRCFQRKEAGE